MANVDNAFGFEPITSNPSARTVDAGGTFAQGDALMFASGKLVIHDAGAAPVAGVAATAGSSGTTALMWSSADTEFSCQAAGTFAVASHVGTTFDIAGATGVQEVDLSATTTNNCMVLSHHPVPGSEDVGADAVVRIVFAEHAAASTPRAT